jgi:hypothetical protein
MIASVLTRLAYLAVTHAFAALRLAPVTPRDSRRSPQTVLSLCPVLGNMR